MNILRPLVNLFNYDLVKKHKVLNLKWHLISLLENLKIDTVIDAGANIGQYGKFLRDIGFTGEIHSFEPIKNYYDQLVLASKNDDKWFSYNYALGREIGSLDINVNESMSSFHEFSGEYKNTYHNDVIKKTTETVRISTIDVFFEDCLSKNIEQKNIYLKMDTQGFDLEVFSGGINNLKSIHAIQSEVALRQLYENMPTFTESLDTYREHGFDVTGFFPVSKHKKTKVIIEMDCVMVNSSIVSQ